MWATRLRIILPPLAININVKSSTKSNDYYIIFVNLLSIERKHGRATLPFMPPPLLKNRMLKLLGDGEA
jgi:hypothetical protein